MSGDGARRTKLLLHVFPSFAAGGAQMRFVALANHFAGAFRHAVIALDGDLGARSRLSSDLSLSFPALEPGDRGLPRRLWRYRRLLAHLRPDVLVTSNWGAIEWAIANLVPLARHIHTEDGFGVEERDRQIPRRVWTRRFALRRSRVVVPSRTLLRIASEAWRLPPRQLRYVPNGIDLARFFPAPEPPQSDVPVLGAVAGLRPEKNLSRLLRAAHLLAATHPLKLVVAGNGPERARLASLASELGLAVAFLGDIADPAPFYRSLDLFALSSDTEQMPLSVLEAMASGLPVAATDVGDIAAMVAPENRPFISGRDDASLARSIGALIDAASLRRAIGAANRHRAMHEFDELTMFRRYRALLEGVEGEEQDA
ncbi:MAG TPA: glycosyltransferase family 4 protein [Acetobacteraceae bacterium]|nr:glycosyltransferase family 4 protein [Acetobacteraceae bacterium]